MKAFYLNLSGDRCPVDIEELEAVAEDTAVVVGNFDGFHLGHRYLVNILRQRAGEKGLRSTVVTFCPHPLRVIARGLHLCDLSTPEEKIELLSTAGIDYLCFVRFTEEFAKLSARAFLREVLYRRLRCRFLLVGYDWRFGYRREGEVELAKEVGNELGFEVETAEPYRKNGHVISSTLIRRLLSEGRLESVAEFLGRRYWIRREVVPGDGRGSLIGFPTANLGNTENLCLKEGVYAVLVEERYRGVANFGWRPTFGRRKKVLEVHIPGFRGDLKGRSIKVEFLRFLREERRFSGIEELREQIEKDIQSALAV